MQEKIKPIKKSRLNATVPKFKGRAKLELFEDGKKVKEVIEDNIFTNALDYVFNPPRLTTCQEPDYDMLNNLDLKTTALGGILIYEDRIEENSETVVAPLDNTLIGCAGGTYSGADTKRGTLNATESGFIDPEDQTKGYRFVYDFPTDKANGKIACLALTSQIGGMTGYGAGRCYNSYSGYPLFVNRMDFSTSGGNSYSFGLQLQLPRDFQKRAPMSTGFYCGQTSDGYSRFFYNEGDDGAKKYYKIVEIPTENFKIGLTNLTDWREAAAPAVNQFKREYPFELTYSYTSGSTQYSNISVRGNTIYVIWAKNGSCKDIEYYTINAETKEVSALQTVTLAVAALGNSGTLFFQPFNDGWLGGSYSESDFYYYPKTGGTGTKINFAEKVAAQGGGDITGTISTVTNIMPYSSEDGTGILFYLSSGGYAAISNDLRKVMFMYSPSGIGTFQALYSGKCEGVEISVTSIGSNYTYNLLNPHGALFAPYLATINNLSSPVTKTNAQTMKITYEITVAEEVNA